MNSEEKKKEGVRKIVEGKLDSYGVTRRSLYSMLGIFGCLALTLVWSVVGTSFDPSVFSSWSYWVSLIIQYAIAIFSMITGRQMGDDTGHNRPDGQYRRELRLYEAERMRVDSMKVFEYFDAWLDGFRERKLQKKIRETLRDFGITQDEVLDLDISELGELSHPYRKSWKGTPFEGKYKDDETIFMSLDPEQLEALRQIRKGAIKVPSVSSSYFMNALKGTSVDEWDRASAADKKKTWRLASGYSYRMVLMLVISVALNGIVPAPYTDAVAATVAMNIVQRVFTLISSTVWGFYLGGKVVDMDIVFLAYKTLMLKTYVSECESGHFVPETIEQKAKREYEEYEEEKRKAAESVITPDVMTPEGEDLGITLIEGR